VAERFYNVTNGGSLHKCHSGPWSKAIGDRVQAEHAPQQHLYISLLDDRCTVSLDLAGEELYKRGHQRFVNDAPLKETIAAAMLFEAFEILRLRATHSAQDDTKSFPRITLIDPMAGSGTFSLEAAYMANGIIPGKCRDFALKHQPAFKEASWNYLVNSEFGVQNSELRTIITSDISERAVEIIRHNVECSPLAKIEPAPIAPQQKDFFSYTPEKIAKLRSESQAVIVLNPPYGKRLDADAPKLYARIGKKLSELAQGIGRPLVVAILAPKGACTEKLLKNCAALGLASTKVIKTSHGGISLNCFVGKI
jgi:putative N6-adenine-specific DNA methylase